MSKGKIIKPRQPQKSENHLEKQGILITFTEAVEEEVITQAFSKEYGARPLRRFIQKEIETFLAKNLIQGKILSKVPVTIDVKNHLFQIKSSDS